jgi:hypothetical protein
VKTSWGPGQKRLASGHVMGLWKNHRLMSGDTVYWADCTDGWEGKKRTDYNDAETDFGEHLKLQHGGK